MIFPRKNNAHKHTENQREQIEFTIEFKFQEIILWSFASAQKKHAQE